MNLVKKSQKEEQIEESWNIKRIAVTLIVLLLLIIGGTFFVKNSFSPDTKSKKALGDVLSAKEDRLENVIQEQFETIKKQAIDIDALEIASSSPEIQKLIDNLKSLKDYPKSQLKKTCEQFCRDL